MMLRITMSKIKKACALALSTKSRGNKKAFQGKFQKLMVIGAAERSTKTGMDTCVQCKRCKQIIEFIFGPTSTIDDLRQIQGKSEEAVYKNETQCETCNRLIAEAFGENIHTVHTTTAKQTEEQLAQKIETIDETPTVEAEKQTKIEGFNIAPRVLGHITEATTIDHNNNCRINTSNNANTTDEDSTSIKEKIEMLVRNTETANLFEQLFSHIKWEEDWQRATLNFATSDSGLNERCGGSNRYPHDSKPLRGTPSGQIVDNLVKEIKNLDIHRRSKNSTMIMNINESKKPENPDKKSERGSPCSDKELNESIQAALKFNKKINYVPEDGYDYNVALNVKCTGHDSGMKRRGSTSDDNKAKDLTPRHALGPDQPMKHALLQSVVTFDPNKNCSKHTTNFSQQEDKDETNEDSVAKEQHYEAQQNALNQLKQTPSQTLQWDPNTQRYYDPSATNSQFYYHSYFQNSYPGYNWQIETPGVNMHTPGNESTYQSNDMKQYRAQNLTDNAADSQSCPLEQLQDQAIPREKVLLGLLHPQSIYAYEDKAEYESIHQKTPIQSMELRPHLQTCQKSVHTVLYFPVTVTGPTEDSKMFDGTRVSEAENLLVHNAICTDQKTPVAAIELRPSLQTIHKTISTVLTSSYEISSGLTKMNESDRKQLPKACRALVKSKFAQNVMPTKKTSRNQALVQHPPEEDPALLFETVYTTDKIINPASHSLDQKYISPDLKTPIQATNLRPDFDKSIPPKLDAAFSRQFFEPHMLNQIEENERASNESKANSLDSSETLLLTRDNFSDYLKTSIELSSKPEGTPETLLSEKNISPDEKTPIQCTELRPVLKGYTPSDNIKAFSSSVTFEIPPMLSPKEESKNELSLSEMLRWVRERNRTQKMEVDVCTRYKIKSKDLNPSKPSDSDPKSHHMQMIGDVQEKQVDSVEGKCGDKKPPCPSCTPHCPAPPSCPPPPCPPAPSPCPKPCAPCCPPPPSRPTCPKPHSKPCKLKKIGDIFNHHIYTQLLGFRFTGLPYRRSSMPVNYYYYQAKKVFIKGRNEDVYPLEDLVTNLPSKPHNRDMEKFNKMLEKLILARTFDPWVPIPCWPVPKKIEKKPFICPKKGCVNLPPPKPSPCDKQEDPCVSFPKRRSFSLPGLLFSLSFDDNDPILDVREC